MEFNTAKEYIEFIDQHGQEWSDDSDMIAEVMEDYAMMTHKRLVKQSDSLPIVSKSTIKHKIQQGMTDCGWSILRSFQENESWETAIAHLVKYLEKKGINVC